MIKKYKNMKHLFLLTFTLFSLVLRGQDLTRYVNPFIGTGLSMVSGYPCNTNPGAVRPWGMASISPFNYDGDRALSSVYVHGNKYISGFSHLNLSGTGCREMGVFVLMPTTGNLELKASNYWSEFSDELASPGYYTCKLNRYNIKAEVTTTTRTSICRYTFPAGTSNILVNTGLALTSNKGGTIRRVSDTEVEGSRMIGGILWHKHHPDGIFCHQAEQTACFLRGVE
jgi:putative alpha-1,2-mannosidase